MKKSIYHLFCFICICSIIFFCFGCDHINECYQITQNDDRTYDYTITDKTGNTLLSDTNLIHEPHIDIINESLLRIYVQYGTGLSTRQTQYCDIDNGFISEIFTSVLGEYENKVVFVSYHDGTHSIVVQDIFDKSSFYRETVLTDVSSIADPVVGLEILENGIAKITYLEGIDCAEKEIYIELE